MFDRVSNFLRTTDIANIKKILNQGYVLARQPAIITTSKSWLDTMIRKGQVIGPVLKFMVDVGS